MTSNTNDVNECSAVRQVLGFHILHSFLFSAFLFSSVYDDSFRNSFSIPNRFLPLGLFPIIRPSITSLRRLSPLSIQSNFSSFSRSHQHDNAAIIGPCDSEGRGKTLICCSADLLIWR